jgi:hypothetical protein
VASRYPRYMVSKRWAWLAGLGLLFAGLTNAHSHIHYCFDGQEPPAAVHLTDSTDHHHELPGHHHDDGIAHDRAAHAGTEHDGADHDDLDLDVPNQALAKVVKHDLPAIAGLAFAVPVEALRRSALAVSVDTPPHPNPRYALPQLRAPPR